VGAPTSSVAGNAPVKPAPAPSNLAIRVLTAIIGVPGILALLYLAPPWGFYLLVLPIALIGSSELFAMTHPKDRIAQGIGLALSAIVSLALYLEGHDPRVLITLLVSLPMLGPLITLLRLGDIQTAAMRAFAMGFGPLFVPASLTLLAILRRGHLYPGAELVGTEGPGFCVMSLMFAWFGDTGGYFAGRYLGKRKLYEAVSPKKTVAGALGGLGGSVVGALMASLWYLPSVPLAHSIPLALVAGALGQAGDLGESLIKRSTGVKDSGAIVPGHGGILDRVDALICTTVVVYLYALWIR
jgi:phosphatidate cytidylyltransferase